jgi:hypothetical protein
MAGFTANCPDLMKADDVLVPYFVVHPKYFPLVAPPMKGDLAPGSGRIRDPQRGFGIIEPQKLKKVKMISLSFPKKAC